VVGVHLVGGAFGAVSLGFLDEMTGVDLTQHAETAYDFGSIHLGHTPGHAVTGADQELADQSAESVTGAR
jgi:hypothetical protein